MPNELSTHLRKVVVCGTLLAASLCGGCSVNSQATVEEIQFVSQTVEIACGECQFKMPGSGCDLAIRLDGKAYFVDGSSIDDHGDAHAKDGLYNAIKKAIVSGSIRDGRFAAKNIKLIDE